ncbi:MAG TPA: tyrosine-protein phosphatase [Polyangiales bacterium]|nr:tyrosine-protein phosphatase [Polyangiales bacterium]
MRVRWIVLVLLCACSIGHGAEAVVPTAAGSGEPSLPLADAAAPFAPTPTDAGHALEPMTAPLLDAGHPEQPVAAATLDAGTAREGSRAVLVGQVENARDLGGVALAKAGHVRAQRLFRGPPLANLSPKDCEEVAKLGLRSVIDLRIDSEVVLKPDQACALENAQLWAAPLPVPYNVSAADYIAVLDARESLMKVFELLGDETRYPVYFHCTWGRDRTGILAAVILLALGANQDAIMEDYLESRSTVGAYPASLEAALAEIERRGGIDAYLTAIGVPAQQLEVLRASAVQ